MKPIDYGLGRAHWVWVWGVLMVMGSASARAQSQEVSSRAEGIFPQLQGVYRHLHAHPELSFAETNTAAYLAGELRSYGFEVTERVGGTGVVGVMRNGSGPCLLVRTDMDGLPLAEQTGLAYASRAEGLNENGDRVGVMHACGHDVHMTGLLGAAELLALSRERWSGTLMMIGQPAEELGAGARAMLAEGLFSRFPRPDHCIAFHVAGDLPAGSVALSPGFAMANVDSVDIEVRGVGGHGAAPHLAVDPVVIGAQIVSALQTISSRETNPLDSVVVTVGVFQAGTKRNIIPDSALLQLTVRTYSDESRERVLGSIQRIARHTAMAAGIEEEDLPRVTIKDEYTPSLYNSPELTLRLKRLFESQLGEDHVMERAPEMIGEDFACYGKTHDAIPICMFRVGTARVDGGVVAVQSLHSSTFAPEEKPSILTAVVALTAAVEELLSPAVDGVSSSGQSR